MIGMIRLFAREEPPAQTELTDWGKAKEDIRKMVADGWSFLPVPHTVGERFKLQLSYRGQAVGTVEGASWIDVVRAALIEARAHLRLPEAA